MHGYLPFAMLFYTCFVLQNVYEDCKETVRLAEHSGKRGWDLEQYNVTPQATDTTHTNNIQELRAVS